MSLCSSFAGNSLKDSSELTLSTESLDEEAKHKEVGTDAVKKRKSFSADDNEFLLM
jgi:hypothetical protein